MCRRGRRTHMRWLGFGVMHCKLPYTADVSRAEPWQEGGRGGFSNSVYLHFHYSFPSWMSQKQYIFFSMTKSSCDGLQYYCLNNTAFVFVLNYHNGKKK